VSLRGRLLAGVLAVTALGLAALAAVTYAEQRSFLRQRVDQQALSALHAVSRALDVSGINVPGSSPRDTRRGRLGRPPPDRGFGAPPDRSDPGGGGGPPDLNLPPGTYGERRDVGGKVLGHVVLSYGQQAAPAPKVPSRLEAGELVTVGSVGGSGLHYRVVAMSTPDQSGTTVIALPLREVDQTLHRLLVVEVLVIAGVLLVLAVVAWWMVRLGLRPLDRIGETAGAIAGGDLSRRVSPATRRTEVGRLGLALNAMLARLEEAFSERQASEDRLRRFLADASHELRTPLSSIRGYAELLRTGVAQSPADSRKATARIEQEAARMGVLVEDLLTLARLDEVRDPIRADVDLAELARDTVEDACATAPDRSIGLRADGLAVVLGDPHQLRQVLANLVGNALVHTPPGTPIEVSVTTTVDGACVEVCDRGPGLPTSDADSLFQRFWRADPGRVRGRGGAGLGLAIVAGVVATHGGEVEARTTKGGGATFVVRFPARGEPVGEQPSPGAELRAPADCPRDRGHARLGA